MDFEEFMNWAMDFLDDWKEFQTLGGRSQFRARCDNDGSITIINSRGRQYTLNTESLREIFERYEAAPPMWRHRYIYYEDPEWPETPNRVAAGYTAAIIRRRAENIRQHQEG